MGEEDARHRAMVSIGTVAWRRRAARLTALLAVLVAVVGCGSSKKSSNAAVSTTGSAAAATNVSGKTLAWIPPIILPFETAMRKGMDLQAGSNGMTFITAGGEYSVNAQITALNAVMQRGVDAIAIWPNDPRALAPSFARIKAKKIPLIVIASPEAEQFADVNFQTDDYEAAVKLAKYAAQRAGKPCRAGIIEGLPTVQILADRNRGMEDGLKQSGCEILAKQEDKNTSASAKQISDAWKTRYGSQMNVLLTYTDNSTLGAMASVGNGFDPIMTGFNGDDPAIQAIKKKGSHFVATGALMSPEIGNGIASAAAQLLAGKALPKRIITPLKIVTTENVSSYQPYATRLSAPMRVTFANEGDKTVLETRPGAGG
jgi:ribose transport system substrate-binding protein